jgi:hypothetical protein
VLLHIASSRGLHEVNPLHLPEQSISQRSPVTRCSSGKASAGASDLAGAGSRMQVQHRGAQPCVASSRSNAAIAGLTRPVHSKRSVRPFVACQATHGNQGAGKPPHSYHRCRACILFSQVAHTTYLAGCMQLICHNFHATSSTALLRLQLVVVANAHVRCPVSQMLTGAR